MSIRKEFEAHAVDSWEGWKLEDGVWLYGTPENGLGVWPEVHNGKVYWKYHMFVNGEKIAAGTFFITGAPTYHTYLNRFVEELKSYE